MSVIRIIGPLVFISSSNFFHLYLQDDAAFKQKQREEQKKLQEAKAAAGKKGPMGKTLRPFKINKYYYHI